MPRADDGSAQVPLVGAVLIAGRGEVAPPGGKALWSQSIFDDFSIGLGYTCCCCCCGAPEAAARVANYVHSLPGGPDTICGLDTSTFWCWCCCPIAFIRGGRRKMREQLRLTGGCFEDVFVGDSCPGCALRQLEMQVATIEAQLSGGSAAVDRMER
jgi:hypothetical protein